MLIEARGLSKSYGQVAALGPVELNVPEGSLGLVGPNGAGKTTLLRLLLGLVRPNAGSVRVLGRDSAANALEVRARVGYMPEHECLIPEMTGVGFVAYMGRLSGLSASTALSRAHDVLQFVGFREERYRRISEYSMGMRQRVKLAQAIVHDPPLCLLDEPTAGLDPQGRDEMLGLLRALTKKTGKSLVLSTHILSDVEGICENLLVLDGGQVLAHGPLQKLLSLGGSSLVVRVKGDPAPFLAALAARGIHAERTGPEIRVQRPPGGEREIFEVALATKSQVRHLGRSLQSVEDLFLELVRRNGEASVAAGGPS
ncbi:MAG: ABC transporter ATP-binding protein [Euryarchaeota archaeon]|nr:ABC transporter ATP-binding protein [Euryarchaeota archaeon]MDE1836454.1 ABC transporter ATP-binding protein [Euryarchaeota archaeon]MDE2044202.1 ABC transporter ATP-binding protein [Thermoplasmata archaeon]